MVSEDGSYVTYAEVDAAATELARRLVAEGVKRDTAVGILFDRCPAVVVSMIAVHKVSLQLVYVEPSHDICRHMHWPAAQVARTPR